MNTVRNEYRDADGFYHDAPVTKANPLPSNNKFIYSAIYYHVAKRVGFGMPTFNTSLVRVHYDRRVRHLNKEAPPLSRDEIIGMAYLKTQVARQIIRDDFCYLPTHLKMPVFNPFALVYQLIKLWWVTRKLQGSEKRNYFWQNKGFEQLFRLPSAFTLPLHDRAFIYRCAGHRIPTIYRWIENYDKKRKAKGRSSASIRAFKYSGDLQNFVNYFPKDHPIVGLIKLGTS